MSQFEESIQTLLELDAPLPLGLRNELQIGHHLLSSIDTDFKRLCSEMRIWTFAETKDSQLSGGGIPGPTDIQFTAPITSLRSATLGIRHEKIFTLQCDHAHCASFGGENIQTMNVYLKDLGDAIRKASSISAETNRNSPLKLEQQVQIEVHGFYENVLITSTETAAIRAFSTKNTLAAFLETGPDELLENRLNEMDIGNDLNSTDPLKQQFIRTKSSRKGRLVPEQDGNQSARSGETPKGRPRRSSGASVRTKSERDPSPNARTPPELQLGPKDLATNEHCETSIAGTHENHAGIAKPNRHSTGASGVLRSDYFPAFNPEVSIGQPIAEFRSSRSETSSMSAVQYTHSRGQIGERIFGQQVHLDAPASRRRRGSESTFNQDMRVSFAKPKRTDRKFVWIHLPFTNPFWVKRVFETLEVKSRRDFSELFSSENWTSRHARGRHSQHHACFVKSACSHIPQAISSEIGSPSLGSPRYGSPLTNQGCMYLYFPFLHFDTYNTLVKRRDMVRRRLAQGRSKPVPASVANDASLEQRMIWEYLGHDPPVNCRRTLDQYRYPSLHDTRARDDDQMLYKMTKERLDLADYINDHHENENAQARRDLSDDESTAGDGAEDLGDDDFGDGSQADSAVEDVLEDESDDILNGNVLMVDQIWLWAIDKGESLPLNTEEFTISGPESGSRKSRS